MNKCGMDLGDQRSEVHVLTPEGELVERCSVRTTRSQLRAWFGARPPMQVAIEVCGASPWVSRVLTELGHQVLVVNARRARVIAESDLKTDRVDAEALAHLLFSHPRFLKLVTHRGEETQRQRCEMQVRTVLVATRTRCINAVRGTVKSFGYRIPRCNASSFATRCRATALPEELLDIVRPLLDLLDDLEHRIAAMDRRLEVLAAGHPVVEAFSEIPGVKTKVALAFVLCIEDPGRFPTSRNVGAYLGMRPRLRESSSRSRRGSITKTGDATMRRLLVQAAHSHLRSSHDTALQRWALGLVPRIGKHKAAVALARKLAVVMHRMWVTGEAYEPFHQARTAA